MNWRQGLDLAGTRPLFDGASAISRARQLDALAEPDRLRVLSAIAARPDGTGAAASLAAELSWTQSM